MAVHQQQVTACVRRKVEQRFSERTTHGCNPAGNQQGEERRNYPGQSRARQRPRPQDGKRQLALVASQKVQHVTFTLTHTNVPSNRRVSAGQRHYAPGKAPFPAPVEWDSGGPPAGWKREPATAAIPPATTAPLSPYSKCHCPGDTCLLIPWVTLPYHTFMAHSQPGPAKLRSLPSPGERKIRPGLGGGRK